jgi:hypothetical protein
MHAGPFYVECARGTDSSAGATLETLVHVSLNVLRHSVDNDSPSLEVADTTIVIPAVSSLKLHNHHTFPSRVNSGLKNIEGQVVITHQIGDDGFVHYLSGKAQHQHFGIHGNPS